MKILSAEQIRQWDEYTIRHQPVSSIDLMERAAVKCTEWLVSNNLATAPIKIFCGKGNNGGDGLAIARLLAKREVSAEVYILKSAINGTPDFELNLSRLQSYRVQIYLIEQANSIPIIQSNETVIDCLFGSGLNRPLDGLTAQLVEHINNSRAAIISIDLPSGMFADQSSISHSIIKAKHTLTFQTLKLCFLLPENEAYVGTVHVLDIGLHGGFFENVHAPFEVVELDFIKKLYKPRKKFSHKGSYGHTLIIAGEKGKMGAALLSVKGSLRSGSGLVSCMIPHDEFPIIQTAAPEAMALAREDISFIDFKRYSAIGIGPGIGTNDASLKVMNETLLAYGNPVVIDADALNLISQNQGLLHNLPNDSILTPHPKEFERIFGKTTDNFERLKLARHHAEKLQVYIILKGSYSMLACPDGDVYFNSTGNPGMATGGSGDVLTGILAGLLSQGYSSKHACILGMYLHGLSGDLAAESISQEALIAGDIVDYLGKAFLVIQ